jgi:hypothetical protein
MTEHAPADAVMNIGGGRRLSAADDALAVEMSGSGGSWTRIRVIPYEDIRALYRFQTTNWGALNTLVMVWIASLGALLIAAGLIGWSSTLTVSTTGGVTLLVLLIAIIQIRSGPARKLKIDAFSGSMLVPDRSPQFFAHLTAQVSLRAQTTAATPAVQLEGSLSNSEPVTTPATATDNP